MRTRQRIGIYCGRHASQGGGIGVYARSLILALAERLGNGEDQGREYVIYADRVILTPEFCRELFANSYYIAESGAESGTGLFTSADTHFAPLPNGEKARILVRELPLSSRRFALGRRSRFLLDQLQVPLQARRDQLDLLHCVSNIGLSLLPQGWGPDQLVTVHDLNQAWPSENERHGKGSRTVQRMYRSFFRRQAARQVPLICDNRTVLEELGRRFPERKASAQVIAQVIPLGIDRKVSEVSQKLRSSYKSLASELLPAERASTGLEDGRYLLWYSEDPRKNFQTQFLAWLRTGTDAELLLLGVEKKSESSAKKMLKRIASSVGSDYSKHFEPGKIHCRGWLSREALIKEFLIARCLLAASLSEGFGYPSLEAVALGLPVVSPALEHLAPFHANSAAGSGGEVSIAEPGASESGCVFICEPESVDSVSAAITRAHAFSRQRREYQQKNSRIESILAVRSQRVQQYEIKTMAEVAAETSSVYAGLLGK